jgi:hypothetical protein
MIVIQDEKSLKLVRQIEHAQFSLNLLLTSDCSVPTSVRLAIKHHDDGWREYDAHPRVGDHQLIDYRSVPLKTHLDILSKSVERAACHDVYAGWLVSRHGCSFHDAKKDSNVQTFLTKQEERRERLSSKFERGEPKQKTRDFNLLQFFDALSLYLIDPWSDCFEWNRDHPGSVQIHTKSIECFTYTSDNLILRDSEFEFTYRTVPILDDPTEDTLQGYDDKSDSATGAILLKES